MFKNIIMIIIGIAIVPYGIDSVGNLKDDDSSRDLKRIFFSFIITIGIVLIGNSLYQIAICNRINDISSDSRSPDIFSSPSSQINNSENI